MLARHLARSLRFRNFLQHTLRENTFHYQINKNFVRLPARKSLSGLKLPGALVCHSSIATTTSEDRQERRGETTVDLIQRKILKEENEEYDDYWEEEAENEEEPKLGDGGDGGGIVLNDVPWGIKALSLAEEVLLPYKDDLKIYAFKVNSHGFVRVRLDKISSKYGCPTINDLKSFNHAYALCLEDAGKKGDVPENLAIEVSSPGAERILKVPEELQRFKDLPMWVSYADNQLDSTAETDSQVEPTAETKHQEGVFQLYSIDHDLGHCTWKLANVRVNRVKGRALKKKKSSWTLQLPFDSIKMVRLYVEDI